MREWSAFFADKPQPEIVERGDLGADALKRFDRAWRAREYDGREFAGMWILDHATEQQDVIRAEGRCPEGYHERHAE